jgi:hypothetical protein
MKKYTIQGVTDEVDTCDCCGRTDLKRAVALADENGGVSFMGVVCAAAALKLPADEVRTGAKNAQLAKDMAMSAAKQAKAQAEFHAWAKFLRERTGLAEIAPAIEKLGGIAAARAAFRAQVGA